MTTTMTPAPVQPADAPLAAGPRLAGTRRPERALLVYYFLQSLVTGPGIIILLPLRTFRYRTLRYQFDAEGVTVSWGILFRRAVTLTYARIQDIHLVSNIVERWLGLGRVQIQTASGQAAAEVTIEGLRDFEFVRDELYRRMRGARGHDGAVHHAGEDASALTEVADALRAVTAELRALRVAMTEKES